MATEQSNLNMSLDVAADGMSATLTLNVDEIEDAVPVTAEQCLSLLRSNGISLSDEVTGEVLSLVKLHAVDSTSPHSNVVATGQPATPGEDGRLEFNEGFDPDEERDLASGNGPGVDDSVDYYNRSAFCLVNVGNEIGHLYPPGEGEPGRKVTGDPLPPRPGADFNLKVDDTEIEVKSDGSIIALKAGLLSRDGNALNVRSNLEVPGFVDFSTGNILFQGDVEIKEGVRDCFVVDVTGSVIIHGQVEAATIRTGLDATLTGGMAAREKGVVEIGRDFVAHYLNGVTGVVGQNMTIDKEIINCQLVVKGMLMGENAAVAGGRLRVGGSVIIGELGADSGTPTELAIGVNAEVEEMDAKIQSIVDEIQDRSKAFQPEHDTLKSNERKLSKDQQKRYRELRTVLRDLQELESSVTEAQEGLHVVADRCVLIDITVQRLIQPGLRMNLGEVTADFNDEMTGPVRFFRDANGAIVAQDLKSGEPPIPLNAIARVCQVHQPKEDEQASETDSAKAAA